MKKVQKKSKVAAPVAPAKEEIKSAIVPFEKPPIDLAALNSQVFRQAAETLYEYLIRGVGSKFSCDNINRATQDLGTSKFVGESLEIAFFYEMFENDADKKEKLGWWQLIDNHKYDFESRFIALLLCAEIIESVTNNS
jgi:hypothetical protein